MSERFEFDQYHRYEPLAEFHFNLDDDEDLYDDEYVYCLCSRVFTRDYVKANKVEKECGSESDNDMLPSPELDDHSHVHFSIETSHKTKCEKDEGASCYCSASHTDNYCSTDEHDNAQIHGYTTNALQPSDSGADLTYQDYHSDYTTLGPHFDTIEQDIPDVEQESNEDYLTEKTWEKFWAIHGERIIWASWIKKYSDYINPAYLGENNDLLVDDNVQKNQYSETNYDTVDSPLTNNENVRERKFSYDSKVNPCKKDTKNQESLEKQNKVNDTGDMVDIWLPIGRRRSSSEHDRILSPKTLAGTDSMTNVTKVTLSSYNVTSSRVTSDSSPTDDYSVSSSTSDDQFNDQTRVANVDENTEQLSEEFDTDQYWQLLWKKHFGEQYALHYANYIESHENHNRDVVQCTVISQEECTDPKIESIKADNECENSEGNSQELPSVIEVQSKISEVNLVEKKQKPKRNNKKSKLLNSVGVLLQSLLKEQKSIDSNEVTEAGEGEKKSENNDYDTGDQVNGSSTTNNASDQQTCDNSINTNKYNSEDEGDEPPEKRTTSLKRSHEIDDEEEVTSEKIKTTLGIMGFCFDSNNIPKGQLIYKKRIGKLRIPGYKRSILPKKTYFDEDGNPYNNDNDQESQDDHNASDDEIGFQSDSSKAQTGLLSEEKNPEANTSTDIANVDTVPQSKDEKVSDLTESQNTTLSEVERDSSDVLDKTDEKLEDLTESTNQTKRRRRQKRTSKLEEADLAADLPAELLGNPKMLKYWKKRHSLFHRFDSGIRLDQESWYSVTPERVARHLAERCANDTIVDGFCGAGGNTIQFAATCKKVIAIDIDPKKIELAKHNAEVYGVGDNIEFIVGDFFELAPTLTADIVFLSPPWGGPKYSENIEYDIETMLEPKPASDLMYAARQINHNIALYLPRNSKTDQILSLAQEVGGSVEIEQSFLNRKYIAITAYFY